MVDQIRFFAGAARLLEGRAAGEYMAGHTSIDPPRADRRRRSGHAVELPDDDGGLEVRPGHRRGQHRRPQAVRHDAGHRPCGWPSSSTRPSCCRRASSTSSAATATPAAPWSSTRPRRWWPSPARSAPAWRSPGPRPRTSSACTSSSAARRRSSSSTTPTSRPPSRASRSPATSTPARTAPRPPGCSPAPGIYDDFVAGARPRRRAATATTYANGPGDEDALVPPVNNANQLERVSSFFDDVPDHAAVDAGGKRQGDHGFYFEPTVVSGLQPGRRDDPERDLRSGHHRAAVHRRGRGAAPGPTASSTASRPRCGPRTSAGPCGWPSGSTSAASGSTPTSRWSPRCRTVASSTRGYGKDLSMYGFEDYTRIKHVMANIDS